MINRSVGEYLCERDTQFYFFRAQGIPKTQIALQKGLPWPVVAKAIIDSLSTDFQYGPILEKLTHIEVMDYDSYPRIFKTYKVNKK